MGSKFLTSDQEDVQREINMKTTMGAPAFLNVVAIVFMLSCLIRCNYCIESFPTVVSNNPLWLRWMREQRNNDKHPLAASVSILKLDSDGKEAEQERGERTIHHPRRFHGFAFFNDFVITTTTAKPEVTTLSYPSQQPQLSNGVTFANLLERARLRTSEEGLRTSPLVPNEE